MLSGKAAMTFCVAWMVLLWLYSWRLKSSGLIGHAAVSAAGASVFLLGAATGGQAGAGLMPAAIVFPFHLSREIAKAVSDAGGDRQVGDSTLAVRLGGRRSLRIALWCILGVVVLSLLPYLAGAYGYLYLLPVLLVIYPLLVICMVRIIRAGDDAAALKRASESVSLMLKAAMPAGLAAFFLAGV
jgi:geranylgeranylglycerol-phosphate geranylgeranyltransferase